MVDEFLVVVYDRMQGACKIIEEWSEETGFPVLAKKTEVILFIKRRKINDFRALIMYGKILTLDGGKIFGCLGQQVFLEATY